MQGYAANNEQERQQKRQRGFLRLNRLPNHHYALVAAAILVRDRQGVEVALPHRPASIDGIAHRLARP